MKKNFSGFTIIELLVTITVIGLLSSAVLLYSKNSEKIIALNRTVYDIVDNISQTRTNSLQTQSYLKDKKVCGWGVYIPTVPAAKYYIFADLVDENTSCQKSDLKYSGDYSKEKVKEIDLENNIKISAKSFSSLLFIPPNPDVAFDGSTSTASGIITVESKSNNYRKNIKISKFGQITILKNE